MASNVQSVVCCLGDPVAGNPTQFLMQRAVAAAGLDWTFVTAEVSSAEIEKAFDGIRALKLSGAAFLPPHQAIGHKLVDSLSESALWSGLVRVARRDGASWIGEDTLGAGIVELLRHEQSVQNEASMIAIAGRPWLAQLVRIASHDDWKARLLEIRDAAPSIEPPRSDALVDGLGIGTEQDRTTEASASILAMDLETLATSGKRIETLIVDAYLNPPSKKVLERWCWSERVTLVLVESNPGWEAAIVKLALPSLRILRTPDIAAAKAVINFHFWTGATADLSLMRDALDEYCQW